MTSPRLFILLVVNLAAIANGQPIAIDIRTDQVLNRDADKIGIWVNTFNDPPRPSYAAALRRLRVRSIRYGWQHAVVDPSDLSSQLRTPRDDNVSGFFADGDRMNERFGPAAVATLLRRTGAVGFGILSTDGVNYRGTGDRELVAMAPDHRRDKFVRHAGDWARWAKGNRFRYFEIGNENDIAGRGEHDADTTPWTPDSYADVAVEMARAVKRELPEAKVGINGGLRDAPENEAWFRGIVAARPELVSLVDFLVCHKYEMWLDHSAWRDHPAWDFGRVGEDFRRLRDELFPDARIQVTEIGAWKAGENEAHYRALLNLEMLGNVRMDATVQHVHQWPTRWTTEGGVLDDDDALTPMGLGMAAYTRFAHPILCDNGFNGPVRYFASRDDRSMTVTLINHGDAAIDASVGPIGAVDEVWRLIGSGPLATDTRWVRDQPTPPISGGRVRIKLAGTSAAVLLTHVVAD